MKDIFENFFEGILWFTTSLKVFTLRLPPLWGLVISLGTALF